MKAITIWQPWASLKVGMEKIYETRGWDTSYRGPIAIHAAKRPVRQSMDALAASRHPEDWETERVIKGLFPDPDYLDHLPTGAIVGVGRLVRCNAITEDFLQTLTPQERALGDFSIGRYAWEFEDMVLFAHPVPVAGKQGLWDYRDLDHLFTVFDWRRVAEVRENLARHYGYSPKEAAVILNHEDGWFRCVPKSTVWAGGAAHYDIVPDAEEVKT